MKFTIIKLSFFSKHAYYFQNDSDEDSFNNDRYGSGRYVPSVWSSPHVIRKLTPKLRRKLGPTENNTFMIRCKLELPQIAEFSKQNEI